MQAYCMTPHSELPSVEYIGICCPRWWKPKLQGYHSGRPEHSIFMSVVSVASANCPSTLLHNKAISWTFHAVAILTTSALRAFTLLTSLSLKNRPLGAIIMHLWTLVIRPPRKHKLLVNRWMRKCWWWDLCESDVRSLVFGDRSCFCFARYPNQTWSDDLIN